MSNNVLYPRKYRVLVQTQSGAAFDVSQLRCTFQVERAMNQRPNLAKISVYNLTPELQNTIIQERDRVVVEAGYDGPQYGMIYEGEILQTLASRENVVDYRLTMMALDGGAFLNYGMISGSYAAGSGLRQVVDDSLSKVTIPAQAGQISQEFGQRPLSRGKVVFGLAGDYYRQMAQSEGAVFYVDGGKVNLVRATDPPAGEVVELSPASGLVGTPAQTQYGVSAKCLLNPRLTLGALVKITGEIQGQELQLGQMVRPLDPGGMYRIIKITHTGDTMGQDWYTSIETVSQSGGFPAMITSSDAQPWY